MEKQKPVIGITIGDINGIGPEIIIKCVLDDKLFNYVSLVLYGHGKVLSYYKRLLNIERFSFNQIQSADQVRPGKLSVVNCWPETPEIVPGKEDEQAGKMALAALKKAVSDLKYGKIHGIVTGPVSKTNIRGKDFQFPGHTEFFTKQFEARDSLMLLCSDRLRIGVATGHIPLIQVKETLTKERVKRKLRLMLNALKNDFGLHKPKVAVLGINPHAGESGLLGKEETEIISPVINEFKVHRELVWGPYPADGFFGNGSYTGFDGILAMYHDQGLIPFKIMAFEEGVNFTAGLSIVRTSPDHGTAFNIAGKNQANEQSMRSAIYMTIDIIRNREMITHKQVDSQLLTKESVTQ